MYARPKYELIRKAELALTGATALAAQQIKTALPSTDPIEELMVVVDVTLGSATLTDWIGHGILGLLKKVGLYVSPKEGSYDLLNVSGPGILMLNEQEGMRLDRSTQAARLQNNFNYLLAGSKVRLAYRISFPHPALVGQLRQRSLLDCQNHTADPVLTLDFAASTELATTSANMFTSTAPTVRIFVARRDIGRAQNDAILSSGGFFRQDIRESQTVLAASTTGEQRFAIPSPGEYATLVWAMTKGAATKRLGDFSEKTFASNPGAETLWSLESGGAPLCKFTLADLQLFGDYGRVALPPQYSFQNTAIPTSTAGALTGTATVAAAILASPEFGGPLETGCYCQEPAVFGIDFLGNGIPDIDDLSSTLNANFQSDAVKWELVGNVSTPATYTSALTMIGRRFRSNISPFKILKAA